MRLGLFLPAAIALLMTTTSGRVSGLTSDDARNLEKRKTHSDAKSPVIVELFTSEGCSSCPAADRLLMQLMDEQPIAGVEIIALAQHVDYWNTLNWADPFSSAGSSARQESYARALKKGPIYTPQMVVDGKSALIGSNREQAMTTIERAARSVKLDIQLSQLKPSAPEPDLIQFEAQIAPSSALKSKDLLDVVFVITESGLPPSLSGSENTGPRRTYSAVVREMRLIGRAGGTASPFREQIKTMIPSSWKRENLRAVIFVQERGRRRILGAAAIDINEEREITK